jgi:hypothetical protein
VFLGSFLVFLRIGQDLGIAQISLEVPIPLFHCFQTFKHRDLDPKTSRSRNSGSSSGLAGVAVSCWTPLLTFYHNLPWHNQLFTLAHLRLGDSTTGGTVPKRNCGEAAILSPDSRGRSEARGAMGRPQHRHSE